MQPRKFDPTEIKIGMDVWHPIWGKGRISEYTMENGIRCSFEKSVVKNFNCKSSQIYGEDHYTHLFIDPILIVSL